MWRKIVDALVALVAGGTDSGFDVSLEDGNGTR